MLQKIATNTLSQVFSKFATALISIVLLGILTKYLSLEMYGVYNKVYNYLGIFAFLADLGLYTITIREITQNKQKTATIIGNVLTLRLLLGVVIFFLALGVAYFLPGYNSPLVLSGIAIIGIFTIVSLINSAILALMQAYMKIEFSFISVIAGKILNILLVFGVVFFLFPSGEVTDFGLPLLYIFGAGLIGIIVTTILNYIYATKKILPLTFLFEKEYMSYIFKISLPYGLALFLGVVYFKVDVVLLSLLEPENMANVSIALYSLPMKIVEVLMVLGGFYLNSLLPSLTESFQKKDTKNIQKLLDISWKVLLSTGLCIFVFGTLLRDSIISIIANEEYLLGTGSLYSSSDVFSIVLAVLLFHFISLIFVYILIAVKQQSKLLKINIFVTIFNIVGNIILIPHFSFLGAGIVTVISQILLLVLGYMVTRESIALRFDRVFFILILCISGVFFFIGNMLMQLYSFGVYGDMLIYGFLGGMLYVGATYWLFRRSTDSF